MFCIIRVWKVRIWNNHIIHGLRRWEFWNAGGFSVFSTNLCIMFALHNVRSNSNQETCKKTDRIEISVSKIRILFENYEASCLMQFCFEHRFMISQDN